MGVEDAVMKIEVRFMDVVAGINTARYGCSLHGRTMFYLFLH